MEKGGGGSMWRFAILAPEKRFAVFLFLIKSVLGLNRPVK